MLKACWECLAGSLANREQADNEQQAYGIRLNGDAQRAPPWPGSQLKDENMFILPRRLQYGDQIHISGQFREPRQTLSVGLLTESGGSPDYQNAACQVDVALDRDIQLKRIVNGEPQVPEDYTPESASEYFGDSVFEFQFTLKYAYNGGKIEVDIQGNSYLGQVDLRHDINDIRFLTVSGDVLKVHKLDFEFA